MAFVSDSTIWAVGGVYGREYILCSDNAGATWEEIEVQGADGKFSKVTFTPDGVVWLLGPGRTPNAYTTSDGGKSFVARQIGSVARQIGPSILLDLSFSSDTSGVAVGDKDFIAVTSDGGETWTQSTVPTQGPFFQVVMCDERTGYCRTNKAEVLKTEDGGKTWKSVFSNVYLWSNYLHFYNSDEGFLLAGYEPNIAFLTRNGGDSWETLTIDHGSAITGVDQFSDSQMICITDNGGIISASKFFDSWREVTRRTGPSNHCVDACDSANVCVGRKDGIVLMSSNGGADWRTIEWKSQEAIRGVLFFDKAHVTILTRKGVVIYNPTDGTMGPPMTVVGGLVDWGKANGQNTGFILTKSRMYLTVDRGGQWIEVSAISDIGEDRGKLATLHLVGEHIAYTCTYDGRIYKRNGTNGIWRMIAELPSPTGNYKYSVEDMHFVNDSTGFIVGKDFLPGADQLTDENAVIFATNDGGHSWNRRTKIDYLVDFSKATDIKNFHGLERIVSTDARRIWAIGNWNVLFSNDSGKTWQEQEYPGFRSRLHDLCVCANGDSWIVGRNHLVAKYHSDREARLSRNAFHLSLPTVRGHIELKSSQPSIYNCLGRRLRTHSFGYPTTGLFLRKCLGSRNTQARKVLMIKY